MMANLIFRKYLSEKDKVLALTNSIMESHISDVEEQDDTEIQLESKRNELQRLTKKLDAYVEMRSDGKISKELFLSKCAEVEPKIQRLQEEIKTLSAKLKPKEIADYTEKLTVLQYALEQYTHCDEGENVPECVVEAFVFKILVSKDGFDWYLRFDGNSDKPLRCQLKGNHKQNTKTMVAGDVSPCH